VLPESGLKPDGGPKTLRLQKCLGSLGTQKDVFTLILLLHSKALSDKDNMKPTVRAKADGYAETLLKYQTILTVQTFLRIFQQTTPLSKYLQTSGMGLLTAHRFVTSTQDDLKKYARDDFKGLKTTTDAFVQWANEELNVCETEVEHALPNRRPKTRKMPGELCDYTTISDADSKYEVQVHNVILDTIESNFLCPDVLLKTENYRFRAA